ncbi:hypothetical protein ANN_27922 [Periplaneta americana]|uniref:Uncharacterized protein n=1 Tax=Periplaneta americana TaxID=6978 RepID=A0ABQ8RVI1_PERAM|nr:hypothetical protein ANN_27922 [Periplaneta americana]
MSPGSSTESYPAFARIGLRENPGKNLNQVTCPDRDSNPGHLVSQPDALTVTPQLDAILKHISISAACVLRRDSMVCIHKTEQMVPFTEYFNTRESFVMDQRYKNKGTFTYFPSPKLETELKSSASMEKGLEILRDEYINWRSIMNIVRIGNIKIGDLSFEEMEKFKYLGATVTNINDTREEIKRRINMGNACYYSVEKLLSSSLLSKNLKVRIYKTVILPVLLYGCDTWTLTLREEHRLRMFENKVLRKIFGAKRDEVTGEWRKLHNTELHALYSSPDIIRNLKSRHLRWAGHVARKGESRNAYRVLVGRPEVKRPLGRPRRRWEDNIKMDLREVEYDDRDCINLAQDRDRWRAYVRAAMNIRVP